ncbi:MAG: DUF2089 domain-containing protein [Verrucomicrobia bacterium]|nr:DUF2089 domain-containing protein [Verrucomicrobiota bacterium]MCG2681659.1 DUF2089 domain-containing protein [Kiritimatiellia bacterium]MBU4248112.1 DUF2089 domain-containing protein [Verrucomicrobiota bacterium]MBU4290788.1 DUF2089 domain-containing protein [Verrucomicrobiota bacterium]MBU4429737.1 DUF2089 domain-containing protein [Verrucomicrobiota bacterium]
MRCSTCGIAVEGKFEMSPLARLSLEEQELAVDFLKLSGNLKALAADRDVSYPTLRLRLDKVIECISSPIPQEPRRQKNVLDALEEGDITPAQAEEILKNQGNSEEVK